MSKFEKLKPAIKELEDLAIMKSSTTSAYNEAITSVSKDCEIDAGLLRKLISARIDDKTGLAIEQSEAFIELLEGVA
jgi:hypothetical protein